MQSIRKKTALFIVFAYVLLTFCGCGSKTNLNIQAEQSKGMDEETLISNDDIYTLTNKRYALTLDAETTHFKLKDLKTKVTYSSVPDFACSVEADETQRRFVSEMAITYYDTNSMAHFMCSTADSVEMGGATVASDGERIRVTYMFGETNSDELVPMVFTEEDFNKISEQLTNSQKRWFGLYYTLYSKADAPDDFEEKAELYPALESQPLYLLNDNVFEADRTNIDSYLEAAGYTEEDYRKTVEEFSIPDAMEESVGFTIPVEYSLNEKGLNAKILTDLITENSEDFKLATIELLPFFGARNSKESGYFLVPDGNGAIIDMNSVSEGYYNHRIYGDDVALYKQEKTMLTESQSMPVFGMSCTNGSYLAVVEGAASTADINVSSYSVSNPANSAWITFNYRIVEAETNAQMAAPGSADGVYNIYRKAGFIELPAVTYIFGESGISYSDMADTYRTYLAEKGYLENSKEDAPVLLDFICGYRTEKSVMGISYTATETLTTLAQVKDILNGLYEKGVEGISVRLLGYSDGGLSHGAYTKCAIRKDVGTEDELKELSKLVSDHGGTLYLEADFQTVYTDERGDSYSQRADSAYHVNKKIVTVKDYHVVTREYLTENSASFVSPRVYHNFSQMFISDIEGKLDVGVSYTNAGKLLGGDYSDKAFWGRDAAKRQMTEALANVSESNKVLVGGSNEYAAFYAGAATDVSITSSMYDIEKRGVPFWQLVFHGSLPYSSEASNLAGDKALYDLKAVEYGCRLHYTLMGSSDEALLGQTMQEKYHSLSYENWIDAISEQYLSCKDFWSRTTGVKMISHEAIADDVYLTRYENGSFSVVNYGDKAYVGKNYTVAPYDYYLKGGN